jgi:uncharacterized membrane protein YidH (DUF202 family)
MTEDPGLQPQRTTLAWTRTAIGCGALTGFLVRNAVVTGRVVDVVGAALTATMTVLVLVLGRRRRDRIRACLVAERSPLVPHAVVTVTALASAAAGAVIIGIVTADME